MIEHEVTKDQVSDTKYTERLKAIQLAFIDDPRQAALDADDLVAELLRTIADDVARRRDELEAAGDGGSGSPDTENLRLAVRRSRELVTLLTQSGLSPRRATE
jgi:hypothetical protein